MEGHKEKKKREKERRKKFPHNSRLSGFKRARPRSAGVLNCCRVLLQRYYFSLSAMADPDFRTKSGEQCRCGDCDFIRCELIPEMVHDRRFCESGSREFVELDSVDIEHLRGIRDYTTKLYRVMARIKFSGETCSFPLVIKLPKTDAQSLPSGPFQNEEMFYSKMALEYRTNGIPKCYLSDLGRYGRPVIVLEDLTAHGYAHVNDKLDEDHLKLCVKALAAFHGRGLRLKAREFPVFREFYAKLFVPDSLYSIQQKLDAR